MINFCCILFYNLYALLKLRRLNKAFKDHGRSTFFFVCVTFLSKQWKSVQEKVWNFLYHSLLVSMYMNYLGCGNEKVVVVLKSYRKTIRRGMVGGRGLMGEGVLNQT